MNLREPWVYKTVIAGITLVVITVLGTVGFAVFWTWYWTAALKETNSEGFKPQEKPGARTVQAQAVLLEKKEPRLESRSEAQNLENPFPPTSDSLKKGQEFYENICSPCHGMNGNGLGVMGTVPNLAALPPEESLSLGEYLGEFSSLPPPAVDVNYVQNLPAGDIFYTITYGGYAIMPGFKDALNADERWHLVNYIKEGIGRDDVGQ